MPAHSVEDYGLASLGPGRLSISLAAPLLDSRGQQHHGDRHPQQLRVYTTNGHIAEGKTNPALGTNRTTTLGFTSRQVRAKTIRLLRVVSTFVSPLPSRVPKARTRKGRVEREKPKPEVAWTAAPATTAGTAISHWASKVRMPGRRPGGPGSAGTCTHGRVPRATPRRPSVPRG